jgi:hypothetical protein
MSDTWMKKKKKTHTHTHTHTHTQQRAVPITYCNCIGLFITCMAIGLLTVLAVPPSSAMWPTEGTTNSSVWQVHTLQKNSKIIMVYFLNYRCVIHTFQPHYGWWDEAETRNNSACTINLKWSIIRLYPEGKMVHTNKNSILPQLIMTT